MSRIALVGSQPHDALYLVPALEVAGHVVIPLDRLTDPAQLNGLPHCTVLCGFVCDQLDAPMLARLYEHGVRLVVQRAAGIDNVDLDAARALRLRIARVPAYSPESVAEHALALLLAVMRHIPQAVAQTRQGNFALDGLLGDTVFGKTVGIVGLGRIGRAFARIAQGFGCRVLGTSRSSVVIPGIEIVPADVLWQQADIVSLHCPLEAATRHLVNADTLARARPGQILINTARGGVVDTAAVLDALDAGTLAAYAADVYENEACVFFRDCSVCGYDDPMLHRLLSHPRALITPHQGFFTHQALREIATSVTASVNAFATGGATPDFVV